MKRGPIPWLFLGGWRVASGSVTRTWTSCSKLTEQRNSIVHELKFNFLHPGEIDRIKAVRVIS